MTTPLPDGGVLLLHFCFVCVRGERPVCVIETFYTEDFKVEEGETVGLFRRKVLFVVAKVKTKVIERTLQRQNYPHDDPYKVTKVLTLFRHTPDSWNNHRLLSINVRCLFIHFYLI